MPRVRTPPGKIVTIKQMEGQSHEIRLRPDGTITRADAERISNGWVKAKQTKNRNSAKRIADIKPLHYSLRPVISIYDLVFFKPGEEDGRRYRDCPNAGDAPGGGLSIPKLDDSDVWFMLKQETSAIDVLAEIGWDVEYVDERDVTPTAQPYGGILWSWEYSMMSKAKAEQVQMQLKGHLMVN